MHLLYVESFLYHILYVEQKISKNQTKKLQIVISPLPCVIACVLFVCVCVCVCVCVEGGGGTTL